MFDHESVTYGEIRGMLAAFASLTFDNVNIGYTFDFEHIEKQGNAHTTLLLSVQRFADTIETSPILDWKETIFVVLKEWFFQKGIFPHWYERTWFDQHIRELIEKIEHLVQPEVVWQVEVDWNQKGSITALYWKDFALENAHSIYLLHLSLSD